MDTEIVDAMRTIERKLINLETYINDEDSVWAALDRVWHHLYGGGKDA